MADPVSLALAIAGVAAPVFKFSIAAIHFILDIKDVLKDQEYLVLSLRLKEQRLYTWGEHVGLVVYKGNRKSRDDEEEDGGDENSLMEARTKFIVFVAHRGLVLNLLVQISVLFDDFQKHQIRHKRLRKVEGFEGILDPATINEDLVLDRKQSLLKEALESFRSTTAGVRRRARWTSFNMKEFEELIRHFSSLNDSITGLLDSKLQKDIDNTTQDIYREGLQMATKQEQFKEIIEAIKFGQQVQGSQEKDLKTMMELASFEAFYSDVDNQENAGLLDYVSLDIVRPFKMTASIDQIKLEDVADEAERFTTYHGSRLKGWYFSTPNPSEESQDVWIEWKMYPSCDGVYLTEYLQIAQQRDFELASTLAQLLNVEDKREQLRVPYCLGYFDGRQHS